MSYHKIGSILACCCLTLLNAIATQAFEYSFSGFGTIGAAISDNATTYQRYIDDGGTFARDSLLGGQFDTRLNEQWGAAAQMIVAAKTDSDSGIAPQLKWTFLSYRPSNDWLLRLGRLSLGGLLNQQNMDVGVSYDMARLPNEVYLLSSSYDFDGMSIAKTWSTTDYEITLEGSTGIQNRYFRVTTYVGGAAYYSADVIGGGFVVTVSNYDRTMVRAGWHMNSIEFDDSQGVLSKYRFAPIGNGLYTLAQPGLKSSTRANSLFLGASVPFGGFTLSGEFTALLVEDLDPAPPTYSAYGSVSHPWGNWVPYLTYARIWTDSDGLDTWRKVRGATPVQGLVSQANIDDAAIRMAVFDQSSWMLGTAYTLSPKQKLKAEVMLTHIGERSAMFDGTIADEEAMVYSLSYNFSF